MANIGALAFRIPMMLTLQKQMYIEIHHSNVAMLRAYVAHASSTNPILPILPQSRDIWHSTSVVWSTLLEVPSIKSCDDSGKPSKPRLKTVSHTIITMSANDHCSFAKEKNNAS